jgi:hypothetical protein
MHSERRPKLCSSPTNNDPNEHRDGLGHHNRHSDSTFHRHRHRNEDRCFDGNDNRNHDCIY